MNVVKIGAGMIGIHIVRELIEERLEVVLWGTPEATRGAGEDSIIWSIMKIEAVPRR